MKTHNYGLSRVVNSQTVITDYIHEINSTVKHLKLTQAKVLILPISVAVM